MPCIPRTLFRGNGRAECVVSGRLMRFNVHFDLVSAKWSMGWRRVSRMAGSPSEKAS